MRRNNVVCCDQEAKETGGSYTDANSSYRKPFDEQNIKIDDMRLSVGL